MQQQACCRVLKGSNEMKKKVMNKLNAVAAIVFFISGSAVDSESWIPIIICAASLIWMLLFFDFSDESGDCVDVDR